MFYEPDKNDHGLRYNPFKACVAPRPIGWLTTMDKTGAINLAPYSFFNAMSYNPPYVMFSAGSHEDHGLKDSARNVLETGEFVCNMATWDLRDQMTKTGLIAEHGINEMEAAGLEPLPSRLVKPPRVKGSPVHLECKHFKTVDLPGNTPDHTHTMIIGKVIGVHIDDRFIHDGIFDVTLAKPIARLGYKDYCVVTEVFEMEKSTPEEKIKAVAAE